MRSDFYVYLHRDSAGNIFYVGKGAGQRAWSLDRHPTWERHVTKNLAGDFTVEIFRDGLTEVEALHLEADLIARHGQKLVNWINPRREFDYEAIAAYHRLRPRSSVIRSYCRMF